jgi:hypothetical protein
MGNKYIQDRYDEFLFKFATDFVTSVQKYVPIDTGALIKSVQVSNRSISGNENEVAVTMGDNNNVYYAPAVEFGRGAGVSGRQPTGIKNTAGVPQRFENYKGFQPTRAPLRKGAIAVTNKYKGLLKETSGSITTDKIPTFLRQSLKGVFG